jgi:hypothetical protein
MVLISLTLNVPPLVALILTVQLRAIGVEMIVMHTRQVLVIAEDTIVLLIHQVTVKQTIQRLLSQVTCAARAVEVVAG